MPEHFNLDAHWTFPNWVVIHACTKYKETHGKDIPFIPGQGVEISFTINGIEVPFREIMETFNERIDWHVNQEADKLLKDKCDDLLDLICKLKNEILIKAEERGLEIKDRY